MPIYEYRCAGCKRRVSLFFPSFSSAERRVAEGDIACPRCGSTTLTRLMSRAFLGGSSETETGSDSDFDDGAMPDGMDDMMEGLEGEDPRAVARWARRMKDTMGADLDLGPEFDRALDRIEAGEDPDKVMEDVDPEAMAGGAGDDEALPDADFDEG